MDLRVLLLIVVVLAACSAQPGNVEGNNVVAALEDEKTGIEETAEERFGDEVIAEGFARPIYGDLTELDFINMLLGSDDETVESASAEDPGLSGLLMELAGANVSATCINDVATYLEDLMEYRPYALQMRSSYADFPYLLGIGFTGRTKYDGVYELCTGIRAANNGTPFDGQFCQIYIPIEAEYSLSLGVCTPSSCSNVDLYIITNTLLSMVGIEQGVYYTCITDVPWTGDAIFVVFLLCLFGACVLAGTIYDVVYRRPKIENKGHHTKLHQVEEEHNADEVESLKVEGAAQSNVEGVEEEGAKAEQEGTVNSDTFASQSQLPRQKMAKTFGEILTSLSCVNNGAKIMSCKKIPGSLDALNGIRVISMLWIIWGHTNSFIIFGRLDNPLHVFNNILGKFWFRMTTEATYAVDTFFVLSGLLLTFLTLKHLKKLNGKLNWVLFYFHRFWRLTPLYMICIGIWSSLLIHIGNGPDKIEFLQSAKKVCAENWWANFLYINNLVPYPGSVNLCMGWSWYLANDMQFFIITPAILILLFRPNLKKIGIGSVVGIAMMSCLITTILSGYWGYPLGNYPIPYNNRTASYPPDADRTYAKPWCRIQAYMVGVFVGYALYNIKDQKMKIPLVWNIFGWCLSFAVIFVLIFAMYWSSETDPLPNWFAAIWFGFNRFLFSACIGWVTFSCVTGNGGPINSFLSWGFWQPFSRLTFGAYLIHPMVIFLFLLNEKTSFHWTIYETGYFFIANAVVSYACAFAFSLLIEGPTIGLEKALLKRFK
ncbi:nose resistant to fluoxetine protein 6-like [Apostichopus japonicus]|uniref:nose resistant to fluoxetine protein 6-like n=1 Tax=Stichopus japonicus TaxID=307972 RepID=UPI003AB1F854